MPTLTDLLADPSSIPPDATVYLRGPAAPDSAAYVVHSDEEAPQPSHLEYLLEVELIEDVLTTWSSWRSGRTPTATEAAEAVIYYAQHDAYLPA